MKHIFLFLFLITVSPTLAQPEWLDAATRAVTYPDQDYLTGYGENFEVNSRAEKIESARSNARADLAAKIRVRVSSEYLNVLTEKNSELKELAELKVSSGTNLELAGAQVIEYYDESQQRGYALAVLEKESAFSTAQSRLKILRQELNNLAQAGDNYLDSNDRIKARQAYQKCLNLLSGIEEALAIAHIANLGDMYSHQQLEAAVIHELEQPVNYAAVEQKLNLVWKQELVSLEDAALVLAEKLGTQLNKQDRVVLGSFYYEHTRYTSEFAERLRNYLRGKLQVKWQEVGKGFKPTSRDHRAETVRQAGAEWLIEGRLLPKKNSIKVLVLAQQMTGGSGTATAEVEIPNTLIEAEGLRATPTEYANLLIDAKVLATDELIPGTQALELWTDQGSEGVVIHRGETIRFMIRVNQSGYLRLINVLNNGIKTPLYKNYPINEAKVNQIVVLPDEFDCCPPFGNETVLAYFSTQEFPPMCTKWITIEGESYEVLDSSLKEFVAKTRGLKKKKKQDVTEARISMTTMEKK